ncbi:cobalamin binding intrinsic factor-like [Mustelus asterias]
MSTLTLLILLLPIHTAILCQLCGTPVPARGPVAFFLRALLRSMEGTRPDPHALIALRLARQHDLSREGQILRLLKQDVVEDGTEFSPGTAAWHILALLASCEDPHSVVVEDQRVNLAALLMEKLRTDIVHVDNGRPLTDYHQVSLAILALCKASICLPAEMIEKIFCSAVQLSIREEFTYPVDTMSIAALALRCMSFGNCNHRTPVIKSALQSVVTHILGNVRSDGTIGDLSTTGVAVQALTANQDLLPPGSWECRKSVEKLLQGISNGTFSNPLAASLAIPALENRTLLDIDTLNCSTDTDDLPSLFRKSPIAAYPRAATTTPTHPTPTPTHPTPTPTHPTHTSQTRTHRVHMARIITASTASSTGYISVNYTVMDAVNNNFTQWLILNVPLGSSALDILKEAERISPERFRLDYLQTPWGVVITGINGLYPNMFTTQWYFITGQNHQINDLEEFTPSDGDTILAIFTHRLIPNK